MNRVREVAYMTLGQDSILLTVVRDDKGRQHEFSEDSPSWRRFLDWWEHVKLHSDVATMEARGLCVSVGLWAPGWRGE